MAGSQDQSPSLVAARFLKSWLPEIQRESEDTGRQTVQHTTWLVGLASASITLLAANGRLAGVAGFDTAPVVTLLFLGTVVLGATQRILYHVGESNQRRVLLDFNSKLLPILVGTSTPLELQMLWNKDLIVQELQSFFGLDYAWLMNSQVSLADAQSAYKGQYDLWKETEEERLQLLRTCFTAMRGCPISDEPTIFEPDPNSIEKLRERARITRRLLEWSGYCFFAASGAFVGGMVAFVAYLL